MNPAPSLTIIIFLSAVVASGVISSIRILFNFFHRYQDRIEAETLLEVTKSSVEDWKKEGYLELTSFVQLLVDGVGVLVGTFLFKDLFSGITSPLMSIWLSFSGTTLIVYLVGHQLFPTLIQVGLERFAKPVHWVFSLIWHTLGWFGKSVYLLKNTILKRSGFLKKYRIFSGSDLQNLDTEDNGLEENEAEMVQNVMGIGTTVVKEIFTPRVDCVALDVNSTYADVLKLIKKEKYTRIPVYEDNVDTILGILHVKDLLFLKDPKDKFSLRDNLRPAYFIPRSKMVNDLMREFREEKTHMAIVVDEYGGTAGLITLEDILEEIVGEIQDEDDTELPKISKVSDNTFVIDPIITLDDVNKELDLHMKPKEEVEIDTLGGYLQYLKGSVPQEGDVISQNGYAFEILKMDGQSIEKVKLTVSPSQD